MRTTIRLNERLLAEAKKYAAESGRTLTSVLEDELREIESGCEWVTTDRDFSRLRACGGVIL
jgi:hypothetical protein